MIVNFPPIVPAPIMPLTFRRSRTTTLNAGTTFSLTCLITPNTTGVDTGFTVQSSVIGPGISDMDRVTVSRPALVGGGTYETTVTFNCLREGDIGSYNCSAMVTSSQPNVMTSDPTSGSESVDVGRKLLNSQLNSYYICCFILQLSSLPM